LDTQNYIGNYFLAILEELAERTNRTDQMIRALKGAVDNGATTVIQGLPQLPREWVKKIAPAQQRACRLAGQLSKIHYLLGFREGRTVH
jgi:hypothetical protein